MDPDCDILIVGVEGTQQQFLKHRPAGKAGASLQSRYALCQQLRFIKAELAPEEVLNGQIQ